MNRTGLTLVFLFCSIIVGAAIALWSSNLKEAPSPPSDNKPPEPVVLYSVNGTVLDGTTWEHLAGVHLSLEDSSGKSRTTVTGEDGSYNFRCETDLYTLNAILDGYQPYVKTLTVSNGNKILDLIMFKASSEPPPDGTVITGKVTNAKTGSLLSKVKVKAGNYSTSTGTDGVYTLGVEMGTYNMTVSLNGYKTETILVKSTEKKTYFLDISINPAPTVTLTIVPNYLMTHKQRTAEVKVVLQKVDRTPAAGVTVSFANATAGLPAKFDSERVTTDKYGTATIKWTVLVEPFAERNIWWECTITAFATIDGWNVEGKSYVQVLQPCPSCLINE